MTIKRSHAISAIYAVDPGACNASGLAYELRQMLGDLSEAGWDTDKRNTYPPVVLIVAQLCHLSGLRSVFGPTYTQAELACRKAIEQSTPVAV